MRRQTANEAAAPRKVLTPFNRFGTRRFLAEARRKVWNNAHRLAVARRRGHLDDLVAELEALSQLP